MKAHDIRVVPLAQMNIAAYNPRKVLQKGDSEYEKLENSIDEFGYLQLIVWNEASGNVVAGNQKAQMFQDKGITEAKAIVINEPDLAKEKAMNLALNKITGQWDTDKLKDLFDELLTADIDLALTGFDISEIDLLTIPLDVFDNLDSINIEKAYQEPDQKMLRCPNCSHEDRADRFKKV